MLQLSARTPDDDELHTHIHNILFSFWSLLQYVFFSSSYIFCYHFAQEINLTLKFEIYICLKKKLAVALALTISQIEHLHKKWNKTKTNYKWFEKRW